MIARAIGVLTARFGVLRTWGSLARISVWTAAWCLVISLVVAPQLPTAADRAHEADVPASAVRYVGPLARTDYAGFLPLPSDPAAFTVAWVGGSEVKLREVSVPAAFAERVSAVGGRPLLIDSYNVIAPRLIDAIRAIDTAESSGVDAIVVSLNPAWIRTEWSLRGWPNLDVANVGTLWARPSTWSWALALTAPDDYAWRLSRSAFPVVEAQTRLNERTLDVVDALDILQRPPADVADLGEVEVGDPRLPPGSAMWLVDEYGAAVMVDEDDRVAALIEGIGVSQHEAQFFAGVLLDAVQRTGVPVFLYAAPFSPESLADPDFAVAAQEVEDYWTAVAGQIDSSLVELEPRSLSRDYDSAGTFFNNVHMSDPGPFADVLVGRLCAQWVAADPALECT